MADAGFVAYALDVRRYEKSRPEVMEHATTPYARTKDIVGDIADAVRRISARRSGARPAVIGGSWSSVTAALFASGAGGASISRLVLYTPIFATRNETWIDLIADPEDRSRPDPALSSYRKAASKPDIRKWR